MQAVEAHPHIASLQRQHREIDAQLEELLSHAFYDTMEAQALKKKKLRIKDEIHRARSETRH